MQNCREIGSEFWDIPVCQIESKLFPVETKWFLSGRTALSFIIEDIKKKQELKTVALPSWCCDSMIYPFLNASVSVEFYPVWMDKEFGLLQDISTIRHCDAILVIDYFGYIRDVNQNVFNGIVIRDVTHSIFAKQYSDAQYCFGSLRKWAGFWTGGFAWTNEWATKREIGQVMDSYVALRKNAMEEKERYINGQKEDKVFLEIFAEAEEFLERTDEIVASSERDVIKAQWFDVKSVRQQRRTNATQLLNSLQSLVIFPELNSEDCPLFVPIIVPDGRRDELRKYLIANRIYCPVHWPVTSLHQLDDRTKQLYENELSLVCDQRYTEEDMDRIVRTIQQFYGRK